MHLNDPETVNVLRGLEINFAFLDQAEEVAEEVFDTLMARLGRWDQAEVPEEMIAKTKFHGREWEFVNPETKQPQPPTYMMLTCNPDTHFHWIYRRFHPDSKGTGTGKELLWKRAQQRRESR